jgi:hypothetical protein
MTTYPIKLQILCMAVGALVAGGADGETLASKTSNYNVSFSDSTFGDAAASVSGTYVFSAQTAFSEEFETSVARNAKSVAFDDSGGLTYAARKINPGAYRGTLADDGAAGTIGFDYSTAATDAGHTPLKFGRFGSLATLTVLARAGGSGPTNYDNTISVILPGNWSVSGMSTGDHKYLGVSSGFTLTQNFVYNAAANTTSVSAFDPDYHGGEVATLGFTLYGAGVPEAATWMLMLLGVAGLGATLRARRRSAPRAG